MCPVVFFEPGFRVNRGAVVLIWTHTQFGPCVVTMGVGFNSPPHHQPPPAPIMAFWGAPVALPRAALHAAEAVLNILPTEGREREGEP